LTSNGRLEKRTNTGAAELSAKCQKRPTPAQAQRHGGGHGGGAHVGGGGARIGGGGAHFGGARVGGFSGARVGGTGLASRGYAYRGGYRGGYGGRYYGGGYGGGWGYYGGGLAAGAIVGGLLAAAPYYGGGYYDGYGYDGYGYDGYGYGYEVPADDSGVAYCMQRFRSYDPASGTYLGNDGYRHPCP
jgi:hypothetical protein